MNLSIVIPMHNEARSVQPLLSELVQTLAGREPFEILVVDDGSTDATAECVQAFARGDGHVRLLRHSRRAGQSMAIASGVRAAGAELVALLDGDLQNDPADVDRLVETLAADPEPARVGLVTGHRVARRDTLSRRLASRVANAVRASVLGDATPDTGCGLKLVRRSVFLSLPCFDHMHRFLPALAQRAGMRTLSVAVNHRERLHGASHYTNWKRLCAGIVDLAGVAWLIRRSHVAEASEERA